VLRLTPLADPLVRPDERPSFRALVVGLFGFRRKQLLRALRELTGWPAGRVDGVLSAAAIDGAARVETLPPDRLAHLHAVLVDAGWRQD
jgi:16S rRNA A1518/A1519 N6-dimethyltransferase RsmA/KsgA/DIM1 with predicted DNA glycosylase/AP lyase activity